MQLIHDGSKACEYFCKGIDYVFNQSIKKEQSKVKQTIANQAINNRLKVTIDENISGTFANTFSESRRLCFVATTEKESQEWLKEQIKGLAGDKQTIMIVIVDYFRDSMITSKYIQGTLLRGTPELDILTFIMVEFFERDFILRIEDNYDHKYSYNKLTRSYKNGLKQVIRFFEQSNEDMESKVKNSRRSTYANRSLVE